MRFVVPSSAPSAATPCAAPQRALRPPRQRDCRLLGLCAPPLPPIWGPRLPGALEPTGLSSCGEEVPIHSACHHQNASSDFRCAAGCRQHVMGEGHFAVARERALPRTHELSCGSPPRWRAPSSRRWRRWRPARPQQPRRPPLRRGEAVEHSWRLRRKPRHPRARARRTWRADGSGCARARGEGWVWPPAARRGTFARASLPIFLLSSLAARALFSPAAGARPPACDSRRQGVVFRCRRQAGRAGGQGARAPPSVLLRHCSLPHGSERCPRSPYVRTDAPRVAPAPLPSPSPCPGRTAAHRWRWHR